MDYFLIKQYKEIKYNTEIKFDFLKRKEIWKEQEKKKAICFIQ